MSHAQLALPMLKAEKLKGAVSAGTKPEAKGCGHDEHAVLEFPAARIGLDLNRRQAAQFADQLRQAQRDQEAQYEEQRRLLQELDSIEQGCATLMLALSRAGGAGVTSVCFEPSLSAI
jgi:hypothetical protein